MGSYWYVTAARQAVNLDVALTPVPNGYRSSVNIYRLARGLSQNPDDAYERCTLWAAVGSVVSATVVRQAKADRSTAPVPVAYPLAQSATPPSTGGGGLTPAQLAALATDDELAAAIAAVNAGKADNAAVATLAAAVAGKYVRPAGGIPASDIDTASLAASDAIRDRF